MIAMRMDEMKRGLWGYKKDSVYRYIVSLEESASKRVAERDARLAQMEAEMERQLAGLENEYKTQVAELEATVDALRRENAALREDQGIVFSTMLEAQKYAEQLRADSVRQKQEAREKLSAAVQEKTQQLEGYQGRIQQLRAVIGELLKDFDGRMAEAEQALTLIPTLVPSTELDGETLDGSPDAREAAFAAGPADLSEEDGLSSGSEAPAAGL